MRRTRPTAGYVARAHAAAIGNFASDTYVPRNVADQRGAVHADHDDGVALVQRDAGRTQSGTKGMCETLFLGNFLL